MKCITKLLALAVLSCALSACGCNETSTEYTYNPSFQSSGSSRNVTLKSRHGGVRYGWGTFYPSSMSLNVDGVYFDVVVSADPDWDYYVPGTQWYFDY